VGQAADEPDAHRVEWLATTDPDGKITKRVFPLPRSLANVKRGFSEQKWADSKNWTKKKLARTNNRKCRPGGFQKPDPTVAKARKRLAARFYQFENGALPDRTIPRVDDATLGRILLVVPIPHPDPGSPVQTLSRMEELAENAMEHHLNRDPQAPRTRPGTAQNQHRRTARRSAVQSGGPRLPREHRRWQNVRPTGGRRGG